MHIAIAFFIVKKRLMRVIRNVTRNMRPAKQLSVLPERAFLRAGLLWPGYDRGPVCKPARTSAVRRAIRSSSSVGITHTATRDASLLIKPVP